MVRVLIADDHALIRSGLMQLLQEDRSIREMGEAATGEQTLDKLRESRWDLLLLDINMPDRSGLDIRTHGCWCSAATRSANMHAMCCGPVPADTSPRMPHRRS